jgi:dTDP-4-dehydrorhamnose 3,5-epimerase
MDHKNIKSTKINGLFILERPVFGDERGFFREVFHLDELEQFLGYTFNPVQMNHSHSKPNVLRGIHAERWNKIVYPLNGEVFVAIVDIREDSESFGKVETLNINDENRFGLFIPNGLANSLVVTSDVAIDYIYLVDRYYDGTDTRAIAWDDPDLAINWPIKDPIISERDKNNPKLRDIFPNKFK